MKARGPVTTPTAHSRLAAGEMKDNFLHRHSHRGAFRKGSGLVRPDPTLLGRIGGPEMVEKVIDALYDNIAEDPELRQVFPSHPRREEPKRFFVEWMGGETLYSNHPLAYRGMQRVHYRFVITKRAAALWLRHFKQALEKCGVPPDLVSKIMPPLTAIAHHLVNEKDLALGSLPRTCAGTQSERSRAWSGLSIRVAKGDLEAVRAGVTANPDLVTRRGEDGRTLLWDAVRGRRAEVVRFLIQQGADVNAPACSPMKLNFPFTPPRAPESLVAITPSCLAKWRGYREIADLLLAHGAIVDIYSAAYLGELELMSELLMSEPGLVNAEDPAEDFFPVTPLHHAICGGQKESVQCLLEQGAEVKRHSMWLLTFAARRNRVDLTRLLLEHGAEAKKSILLGPMTNDDHALADLLISSGYDPNASVMWGPLIVRICRGDSGGDPADRVRRLLDYGADVNARDHNGNTALHHAARAGHVAVVAALLEKGADVTVFNKNGESPLTFLPKSRTQTGSIEVMEMLLRHGADLNTKDGKGVTPLRQAIRSKKEELVAWLLSKGARQVDRG